MITQRELTPGIYLVNISGPLNGSQAEQLSRCFQDLYVRDIERVIVNLAEVPFLDGPGLSALVSGYKLFGRNHSFQLVGLQDQPRLVLELTGFQYIFQVLDQPANAGEPAWSRQTWSTYPVSMLTPQTAAMVDMAA
jgi:anti-anti-sigma factor